jgi:hypothetical protein
MRHINNVNFLLEQKYLKDKIKSDRGILLEEQDISTNPKWKNYFCLGSFIKTDGAVVPKTSDNHPGLEYLVKTFNYYKRTQTYFFYNTGAYYVQDDNNGTETVFPEGKDTFYRYSCQNGFLTNVNPLTDKTLYNKYGLKKEVYTDVNFKQEILAGKAQQIKSNNTSFTDEEARAEALIELGFDESSLNQGDNQSGAQDNTSTGGNESGTQDNTSTGSLGFGEVYYNVFTPNVISTIRQKIGNSQETSSTLTQTDINLLYDAINAI